MFDHYHATHDLCSPFFRLFGHPAMGRVAEKAEKRRKEAAKRRF
jgi:hypothetical protein